MGDYNPFEHRDYSKANEDLGAAMHLIKGSLGAGILSMPKAFAITGLVEGTIGTLLLASLCTYCCYILVQVSQEQCRRSEVPSLDYAGTCEHVLKNGPEKLRKYHFCFKVFANSVLLIPYFFIGSVYVVFLGTQTKQLMECSDLSVHHEGHHINLYILPYILPVMLMSQFRALKYLQPVSTLANVTLVICYILVWAFIGRGGLPNIADRNLYSPHLIDLPHFVSIVIFSIENVGVILPVENATKNPQKFLGCGILVGSATFIILLYTIMGFIGYWKYGDLTADVITLNAPPDDPMAKAMKALIIIAIYLSYGLQFYVVTSISWGLLEEKVVNKCQTPWRIEISSTAFRSLLAFGTVVFAMAVPRVGAIMGLVGSILFATIGIFLPALCHFLTFWEETGPLNTMRRARSIGLIILYFFIGGFGLYDALMEIINFDPFAKNCPEYIPDPSKNVTLSRHRFFF